MTTVDITASLENIEIGATGLTEIMQNVRTILSTAKGSVPLDREFGLDSAMVDEPESILRARRVADIVSAIETYEPRVMVTHVDWRGDGDGVVQPTVRVRIKDGVLQS